LQGLPETLKQQRHLYIVTDGDIAHNLGHLFKEDERVKCEVLVIDGVTLWGFDFVTWAAFACLMDRACHRQVAGLQ